MVSPMRRSTAVALAGFAGGFLAFAALASCGSRTGLPGETAEGDAGTDVVPFPDRVEETPEETFEAENDVIEEMPLIDTNRPDVPVINPCPDAAATLIYVIGLSGTLYSFDPTTSSFATIGKIDCPGAGSSTPFSMAVDRKGTAYVIFSAQEADGGEPGTGLYEVSTKNAECKATKYNAAANGFVTFGMGFVANLDDGGSGEAGEDETLFVSLDVGGLSPTNNGELATLDTTTFDIAKIAFFSPSPGVPNAELTGTGLGQLFAFSPSATAGQSFIAQIDPTTAKVIAADPVPGVVEGSGWAFGFWGGDFYTFTTSNSSPTTIVTKFDPNKKTATQVATNPDTIVGAGVSTCAQVSF
jgi:hypothetical protein